MCKCHVECLHIPLNFPSKRKLYNLVTRPPGVRGLLSHQRKERNSRGFGNECLGLVWFSQLFSSDPMDHNGHKHMDQSNSKEMEKHISPVCLDLKGSWIRENTRRLHHKIQKFKQLIDIQHHTASMLCFLQYIFLSIKFELLGGDVWRGENSMQEYQCNTNEEAKFKGIFISILSQCILSGIVFGWYVFWKVGPPFGSSEYMTYPFVKDFEYYSLQNITGKSLIMEVPGELF